MPRTTFINENIKKKDLFGKLYEAGFFHDCADACINTVKKG
jgi:hypothetical protein